MLSKATSRLNVPDASRGRAAGFGLIELITVIVILGVLAATAIPKFVNMQSEARVAKAQAALAAASSASNLFHGAAVVRSGNPSAPVDGVAMENYYPAASASGIVAAMNITDVDIQYPSAGQVDFVVNPSTGSSASVQECKVTYQQAPADGTPAISIVTSAC